MVEYVQDLDKKATESATGQYPVTRPIQMERQRELEGVKAREAGVHPRKTGEATTTTAIRPEEEEAEWGQGSMQGGVTTVPVIVPAVVPLAAEGVGTTGMRTTAAAPLAAEGEGQGTSGMGTTAKPQGRE